MELDFDKEIDILLRKARPAKGVLVGDTKLPHLDADSISAFAENALPEITRGMYMMHFADCNRCREILSDNILLNSEAAPEAAFAAAPTIATAAEPWYRKLFLFPNLAYVMGGLVLMFSAFLGYSVLQNAGSDANMEVSQIEDAPSAASGPNAGEEPTYPATAANSVINAANSISSAANTIANASGVNQQADASNSNSMLAAPARALDARSSNEPPQPTGGVALDGVSATESQPAPPAPLVKERDKAEDKADLAAKDNAKSKVAATETRELSEQNVMRKQLPRTDRGGPAKSAGPQRNQQNQFPNQTQNNEYEVAVTRAVGGKKFQRRDGVWFDSAYRGQGTTNVRRGTEQYRKLDSGLRSIAESLDGTVVTVWKDKAYRIQ